MKEKIEVKNKTNWLLAIILPFALLILLVLILVLLPLFSFRHSVLISIFNYCYSACLPIVFFVFFLYVWLWNTFGKTVLEISSTEINVRQKNKLFSKPKIYLKSEIKDIGILDLSIEKTRYHIRPNYLFSSSNQSITITTAYDQKRIVDWLTPDQANDLLTNIKLAFKFNSI